MFNKRAIITICVIIFPIVTIIYGMQNGSELVDKKKFVTTKYDTLVPHLNSDGWSSLTNEKKMEHITKWKEFLKSTNPNFVSDEDFPKGGVVKNEEIAIKIAEIYWQGIYGDEIYDKLPFVAIRITDSTWRVTNVCPPGQLGGMLLMDIKAINGQVFCIGIEK
jgi:hypothetical protein